MSDDPVTWNQIAEMMTRAARQLDSPDLPAFAQEWLCSLPSSASEDTDRICRYWCFHGSWPQGLSEIQKVLLTLRCLFVIDRCLGRICRGEHHQIEKATRHIELYMTGDWYRDCDLWLSLRNPDGQWNFPFDPWKI